MKLFGMMDSPYVRRTAISMKLLGINFNRQPLSVFENYADFRLINPLVKAPTLVLDDGVTLIDSGLIIEFLEKQSNKSLMPFELNRYKLATRWIGLALVACEKSIQIVYERNLRPPEKQHAPWIQRVREQLLAAYGALENELSETPLDIYDEKLDQLCVTVGVAWRFTQFVLPEIVKEKDHSFLTNFSIATESHPAFQEYSIFRD